MANSANMPSIPSLRRDLAVIPMPKGIQLRAGDEDIHFIETAEPDLARRILVNLDGTRTREEVLREAGTGSEAMVGSLIEELSAQGLLAGAEHADDDEISRYLSHFHARGEVDPSVLARSRVAILGHSPVAGLLAQNLGEHRVKAVLTEGASMFPAAEVGRPDAAVCLWEQPDLSTVLQVNQTVCRTSVPCLFVDLSHGQHATLGPFFVPGEGSCYACFRERLRQNTAAYAEMVSAERHMVSNGTSLPAYGMLPAFRYWLAGLAGVEIVAFLARHRPLRTLNRAITVDYERLQMWSEVAWRVPGCEVCGADRS